MQTTEINTENCLAKKLYSAVSWMSTHREAVVTDFGKAPQSTTARRQNLATDLSIKMRDLNKTKSYLTTI